MCRRRKQRTRVSRKGVIKPPPAERFPASGVLRPSAERYVKAAGQFAAWVWAEINARSAELIGEITTKAVELKLWHDENVGSADWFDRGLRHRPGGTVDSGGRGSAGTDTGMHAGSESGRPTSTGHGAGGGRRLGKGHLVAAWR